MPNKVGWDDIVIRHEWDDEASMARPCIGDTPPVARIAGWQLLRALAGLPQYGVTFPGWDGTVLICGVLYRVVDPDLDVDYLIVEKVDPGNGA